MKRPAAPAKTAAKGNEDIVAYQLVTTGDSNAP